MITLRQLENTGTPESSSVLSLWIHEHYTDIPVCDKSNEQTYRAREEWALLAYERAIELAPREATLHYHKGQVLEQLGRATEAESAYEEARSLGYRN